VVTRDLSNAILPGVTRRIILQAAAEGQIPVEERKFTLDEALDAKEAFLTAATLGASPVVAIDGHTVGDGKPGPVARRIQELYRHVAESAAGKPSAS
jgi:D-alanine transaminase